MGEHQLDKLGVTGSSPVPPTFRGIARTAAGIPYVGRYGGVVYAQKRETAGDGDDRVLAELGDDEAVTDVELERGQH